MHKYHYLYKITNKLTGEYYYGVHSSNDLNDHYFGSGSKLNENIKKYGRENFIKENLEFFESRKELLNAEKSLVNYEMLLDEKCLNVILGGGELKGSIGKKCIVDENGEYKMIDKNDNTYKGFFNGRICINNGKNMKYIVHHDLQRYIDMGWKKGTIYDSPGKNKIWVNNGIEMKQIAKNELNEYIQNGWERGMIKNKIWVNKEGVSIQVKVNEFDQYVSEGWKKGFNKSTVNGRIAVIKDNKIKYINENELTEYLNLGWKKKNWKDIIWMNNGEKNVRVKINEFDQYISEGWKKGRVQNPKRAKGVIIYDLNHNIIQKFNKVSEANKNGYNNIHKYANTDKIYKGKYILEYGKA